MSYHQTGRESPIRHFLKPGLSGLGEVSITSLTAPLSEGWQVEVKFTADNSVSATFATLASALAHYSLDTKFWGRTGAGPFRHTVRVRLDRVMSANEVGAAIQQVFRSYGGVGARGFSYRLPYEYLPSVSASPGRPSAPAAPTVPSPQPVQSTQCTTMGGRCYDFRNPPAGLPAGRWVTGRCADVPGLSTRCYVPGGGRGEGAVRPGSGGGGGSAPDLTTMASPPIFRSGSGPDPATAFMVAGLVALGGVLAYVGYKRFKSSSGLKKAAAKSGARALPRVTNRRRRRRNGEDRRVRFSLEKVRLDRQGYDRRGSYWGTGQPLYSYVFSDEAYGDRYGNIRANDRAHAKELIRRRFPHFTIVFTR